MTALPSLPVVDQMVIVLGIPRVGMSDGHPQVESHLVLLRPRLERPFHKRPDGHPVPVKILKGLDVQRGIPIRSSIRVEKTWRHNKVRIRMRGPLQHGADGRILVF